MGPPVFAERLVTLTDGGRAVLRALGSPDAEALHAHIVRCVGTTDQVLTAPGDVASVGVLREDFARVFEPLRGGLMLGVAAPEDRWVIRGSASLSVRRRLRTAHVGTVGMMLEPAWRGRGLGRVLLEALLAWAREHPALCRVELEVLATNEPGLRLYRGCGFEEEGRKRGAFRRADGRFVDAVQMSVWVG